ncbi:MAG: alpha/beta hydrolase [Bacteriovoracia bacterium]
MGRVGFIINRSWILIGLLASASAFATPCEERLATWVKGQTPADIADGNEPLYLPGTRPERAFLLVHGFMASPFEVKELAEHLNRNGYTVLAPLLDGFGADADTANRAKYPQWAETFHAYLTHIRECFPQVGVAGFSLGASVVTYQLQREAPEAIAQVSGLTLVAPALGLRKLLSASSGLANVVRDEISVDWLFRMGKRSGNYDLEAALEYKTHYNQQMPLEALAQLKELNSQIKRERAQATQLAAIPTTVLYSEHDQTVVAKTTLEHYAPHAKTLWECAIPKAEGVRHQMLLGFKNPLIDHILELAAFSQDLGAQTANLEDKKSVAWPIAKDRGASFCRKIPAPKTRR